MPYEVNKDKNSKAMARPGTADRSASDKAVTNRGRVPGAVIAGAPTQASISTVNSTFGTQALEDARGAPTARSTVNDYDSVLFTPKVSPVSAGIDALAYCSTFDPVEWSGAVPVDVFLVPEEKFSRALKCMTKVFKAGLCVSELVAIARQGERLGEVVVPDGNIGLATVSGMVIGGALLKSGIPLDWKFGGLLQLKGGCAFRFVELIEYQSCSIPPAELFINGRMTNVAEASSSGEGKILASFADVQASCKTQVESVIANLERAGIYGMVKFGKNSGPTCEVPVSNGRIGMVLQSGLNPAAAAVESGIELVVHAMSGVVDYRWLRSVWEL
jgi:repressor of nif and glnA expression